MQYRTTLPLATSCSPAPVTGWVVGMAGEMVYTHMRISAHRSHFVLTDIENMDL